MHIILNHSSMIPIYEQVIAQVKSHIIDCIPNGVLISIGCCLFVVILWISYFCSRRIMEKKTFLLNGLSVCMDDVKNEG